MPYKMLMSRGDSAKPPSGKAHYAFEMGKSQGSNIPTETVDIAVVVSDRGRDVRSTRQVQCEALSAVLNRAMHGLVECRTNQLATRMVFMASSAFRLIELRQRLEGSSHLQQHQSTDYILPDSLVRVFEDAGVEERQMWKNTAEFFDTRSPSLDELKGVYTQQFELLKERLGRVSSSLVHPAFRSGLTVFALRPSG